MYSFILYLAPKLISELYVAILPPELSGYGALAVTAISFCLNSSKIN